MDAEDSLRGRFKNTIGIDFVVHLTRYSLLRGKQAYTVAIYGIIVLLETLESLKQMVVQRMFWGRGNWYKHSFHLIVILVTTAILLTGISRGLNNAQVQAQEFATEYGAQGNTDLLTQGSGISSVVALEASAVNYRVYTHKVGKGETLDTISKEYGVNKATLKWANKQIVSPYNDRIEVGWVLKIPEMNGVLHVVQSGESLNDIVKLTKGNREDIIELNDLVPPAYSLSLGQSIFVPNGELPPPPPRVPAVVASGRPSGGGYVPSGVSSNGSIAGLPKGFFDDPLTHPGCKGYRYMRGFTGWHSGTDLAKGGGCPIRAAGAGTVKHAGWYGGGAGYTIIIDHGNGVETHYYHGSGSIWVKKGQKVSKGQDIMYMGSTGNSSGTHLHLSLVLNHQAINPASYIPYRR